MYPDIVVFPNLMNTIIDDLQPRNVTVTQNKFEATSERRRSKGAGKI